MSEPIIHGTPEWHLARSGCINISNAANILYAGRDGVRGSALSEYQRITHQLRTGMVEEKFDEQTMDVLRWGSESEDFHLDQLAMVYPGVSFWKNSVLKTMPDRHYIKGTPDAFALLNGVNYVVELKAPIQYERWGSECPIGPQTQCRLYMAMMDVEMGIVSALIPPKPRTYIIHRSREWEEWALNKLDVFWNEHVIKGVPPPVSDMFTEADTKALRLIYQEHQEGSWLSGDELLQSIAIRWSSLKDKRKGLEEEEEQCKQMLIAGIGDHEGVVFPNGTRISYKSSHRKVAGNPGAVTITRTLKLLKEKEDES